MTRAFDQVWDHIEKGIIWEGKEYDDIDEILPSILGYYDRFVDDKKANPLPQLPFEGGKGSPGGRARGVPWTQMHREGTSDALTSLAGFQGQDEMMPTFMNWIGGKTSLMPRFRTLAQDVRHDHAPAELFGGSGSFLMGFGAGKDAIYNDINPDLTNIMEQVRGGLGEVSMPRSAEELSEMVDTINYLRRIRDVEGTPLTPDENKFLAELMIGANNTQRDGMFSFKPWDQTPQNWYTDGRYGGIAYRKAAKPPGHPNYRIMPGDVGRLDISPWSNAMKDIEIYNEDFRDAFNFLTPRHLAYWDPPYMSRKVEYGGDVKQDWGMQYDDDQRDVVDLMGEHTGPSIYSNYLFPRDEKDPYRELIDDLLDIDADVFPWMRKPKANKLPQIEVIATTNMPESTKRRLLD